MGRIVVSVDILNPNDITKTLRCDALVDTGASLMILPKAWKERLGEIEEVGDIIVELANQEPMEAKVCGPVKIQIEGFRPIYSEVIFLEMKPPNGIYEPLVGYITLEQSQAGIDMIGHRLVHIKTLDLK